MQFFLFFLVILLFFWAGYLTFIIYRIRSKSVTLPSSSSFKVNLVRFNPFNDLGGDQSFILVLLDEQQNGVVVTSLHSRDRTRVYAKPIKNGQGDNVSLSREEKLAIVKAIKG